MKTLSDVMADLVLLPNDTFDEMADKLRHALDQAGLVIVPKSMWYRRDDEKQSDIQ
jgi:hypothetical protein